MKNELPDEIDNIRELIDSGVFHKDEYFRLVELARSSRNKKIKLSKNVKAKPVSEYIRLMRMDMKVRRRKTPKKEIIQNWYITPSIQIKLE